MCDLRVVLIRLSRFYSAPTDIHDAWKIIKLPQVVRLRLIPLWCIIIIREGRAKARRARTRRVFRDTSDVGHAGELTVTSMGAFTFCDSHHSTFHWTLIPSFSWYLSRECNEYLVEYSFYLITMNGNCITAKPCR